MSAHRYLFKPPDYDSQGIAWRLARRWFGAGGEGRMRFPCRSSIALLVVCAALFVSAAPALAGYGFFKQFVIIDRGSGNVYLGNPLSSGFNGVDLRNGATWYVGDSGPQLKGGEANSYENSNDYVNNVRMFYRINTSAGSGSFTQVDLNWDNNWVGGNRKHDNTGQSVSLAQRSAGDYGLEVYFQGQANNGGWNGQFYDSADPNYRGTFTVTALNKPSGQTATAASSSQINLSWTKGTSGTAKDTVVFRSSSVTPPSLTGGTTYSTTQNATQGVATCIYRGDAQSFNDTGLSASTQYYYHFFAVNNDYYSAAETTNATTQDAASPTITVSGTLSAVNTTYGTASASPTTFNASGVNLTGNLTVAAPSGFEVSTSSGSGYASSITLTASSGTVNSTTIYVRIAASTVPGTYSGNVSVSGGGATTQNVATASTTVSTKALTVTGLTAQNKTYDGLTSATTTGTAALSGIVGSDSVTLSGTPAFTFNSATVGTGKTVSTSGYTLSGTHASRYSLTLPSFTADITARSLTVTANNVVKIIGATLTGGSGSTAFTSSGLQNGETIGSVTISYGTGSAGNAAVGTYTGAVTPSAATGGTFTAGNYSITYASGNITVNAVPNPSSVSAASGGTNSVSLAHTRSSGISVMTVRKQGSAVDFTPSDGTSYSDSQDVGGGNVVLKGTLAADSSTDSGLNPATTYHYKVFSEHYKYYSTGLTASATTDTPPANYGLRDDAGANLPTLTYNLGGSDITEKGSVFNGKNLGSSISTLSLKGANIQIWKQSGGDVTGTKLEYKIWKTSDSEPAAYTEKAVGYSSESAGGTTTQIWSNFGSAIDLISALGSNYGDYNLKVRFTVQGTGWPGTVADGPHTATFTYPQPATISASGTLSALSTTYGTASSTTSFTVSGANMAAGITVAPPSGFEVSTSSGSGFASSIVVGSSGTIASTTVYVRLAATATVGTKSGNIVLSSSGATSVNVATASSTVSKATPSITAAPTASAVYKGARLDFSVLSGGTASVAGSFAFTSAGSTILTATGSQGVTFTPGDTTNYNTASTSVTVTVNAVPDPSAVSAASGGTSSIALTHTRTNGISVMIVRKQGSAVTFTPSDTTVYTDGQDVGSGNVVVKGTLGADSSSDTGLTPSTTYHYKVFSEYYGYYSAGVTASATTDTPPPSISVSGVPGAMSTTYGSASSPGTFSVSAAWLTANLTVTAPDGFEVSTSADSGYASSVTLTPSSGTVNSTTIYVRIKANTAPGSPSGNVTAASTGATSQTVAVSGTVSVPSMSMTISSPAGTMDADYTTSKLFADELAGTTNNVTVTFNTGNSNATEVEIWTNLNNRDRADDDANSDGIPDGIVPPDPPTDKPEGYSSGAYPATGYFQARPMSGSGGTYTLTLNANKTGAYRLTARYRVSGGTWVWYNYGGKRDHAITVTPVVARNMNVYEINVLNVNATGATFQTRSTFESLTNSSNGRVNLDYLRGLGVNTLWFQPIHPNGVENREAPGGAPYDPGSPYAVKNFFEVMEVMTDNYNGGNSGSANRSASMAAFTNFVAAADTKGVSVMLDAPFNHTAHDVELAQKGLDLLAAAGVSTSGWTATDKIKDREARFFSRNDGANAYSGPASSAANIAPAPDRTDFGKWNDVIDVFFGRYSALVTGNPDNDTSKSTANSTTDAINLDDLRGTGGVNATNAAVTRAVWQYFASYVPYWLEKTGLPAGSSLSDQAAKGIDGLRADFGQGMPPQFWEYAINVARERKWSFVFMTESLDGGQVTFRSNRHFDILNENIVGNWQTATTTTAHRAIFEDRRNGGATVNFNAGYGQGLVLLNNTSHDEVGYSDPWQAFIRYAVGGTIDGAPMIMYGQEIGTGAGSGENSGSFDWFEYNFQKWIPHFKRYNSMQKQWDAWSANNLGVKNLMPAYSGVGLAREFSPALRSVNRYFLNPVNSSAADERIFAVAKYEAANASPSSSDVVLAFVNLTRSNNVENTFGIPSGLGTLLGLESNKLYNVRNIAAYLGPNNEYPNRRSQFLWNTPRSGGDILTNGIYVALNGVPTTDAGWATNPHEPQYLKVYAAPVITTSNTPTALSTSFGSASTNTSFSFSATDVHDGVTVTAPSGFHISTNASTGFTNSLSLSNTGTIGSTTLYVRLAGTNNVGTYSGDITLSSPGGNSTTVATASSTVGKAVPSITTAPAASAITYGQALSSSSLTGGAASVAGSFAFTTPATAPNAGTANQSVTFTPTDSANYDTVTLNVSVTVNKATPTITAAPTAGAITYGQTLASSTLSGGTASTAGSFAFTTPATAPNAGTASQSVTFTPTDSANYNTAATSASVTVNAATLPVVNFTAPSSLVYDGSAKTYSAGTTGPSSLTLNYTGRNGTTYNSATAPTNAGDYTVTATTSDANYSGSDAVNFSITAKALTGSFTAANRTYNGTTSATVTGRSVSGAVAGDDVNHTGGTATFASKGVGSGRTVTLAGASLTGSAAGNYTLSSMNTTTANITAKALSIGSPDLTTSKTYDGTTTAAVTAGTLSGVESGDTVTVSAAADYDTAAVGTNKTITVVYTLGGADAANYTKPENTVVTNGSVSGKQLTIGAPTLTKSKVYDATTTAAVTAGTLSGVEGQDVVTVSAGAVYDTAAAGTGKTITVTYTLGGANAGNYAAPSSTEVTDGVITPKALSITGPTLASRAYDGTTMPGALTVGTLSGLVGSQTLTVSGSASNYPSANAGTYSGIAITYTLGNGTNGGLAANYSLSAGTATGIVTSASVSSGDITLTRDGDSWSASASGVSGFTLSYSGRTANGITTTYGPSATAPTLAGYYTVTATSSDANYGGAASTNYAVTGPVPADDAVLRPSANAAFEIPLTTLLTNDKRIADTSGTVATTNLSITAVLSGAGSPTVTISGAFVTFTAGGSGVETFTYTLRDAVTGKTATGAVTVAPEAQVEPLRLLGHTIGTPVYNGRRTSISMTFTGAPNTTYYLYYKGELTHPEWKSVGGLYSETGVFQVTIQESGDHVADWSNSMFFDVRR